MRGFLPTFTFLGKLVDALPALPQTLACNHGKEHTHRHTSCHKWYWCRGKRVVDTEWYCQWLPVRLHFLLLLKWKSNLTHKQCRITSPYCYIKKNLLQYTCSDDLWNCIHLYMTKASVLEECKKVGNEQKGSYFKSFWPLPRSPFTTQLQTRAAFICLDCVLQFSQVDQGKSVWCWLGVPACVVRETEWPADWHFR